MNIQIDKTWTLFLDRDGVINKRLPDDYVKEVSQFEFIDGVLQAISVFSKLFNRIIIVSNQQGIGKGLMTVKQLELIHEEMHQKVKEAGGKIDKVLYSPYLSTEKHFTRKPMIGMGLLAKKEFGDISFRKSVMVGDSVSDMLFGKRLGMKTVYLGEVAEARLKNKIIDYCYQDLKEFARVISEGIAGNQEN